MQRGWLWPSAKAIFRFLFKYTLVFSYVQRIYTKLVKKDWSWAMSDLWVFINLIAAIFLSHLCYDLSNTIFYVFIVYGLFRVWEIILYNTSVTLSPLNTTTGLASVKRSLFLLLLNGVETLFWFALIYIEISKQIGDIGRDYLEFLKSSFYCLISNDPASIVSKSVSYETVAIIEIVVGLFLLVFALARVISSLPNLKNQESNTPNTGYRNPLSPYENGGEANLKKAHPLKSTQR